MDLLTELAILVLAAFVGFEVISKVPNTRHTPLMSTPSAGPNDQRGRRLPRHRPHARDVQVQA